MSIIKKDFFVATLWTSGAKFLALGLGFVTSIMLARILQPAGLGVYQAALSLGGIVIQFCLFGLPQAHVYYGAQGLQNAKHLLSFSTKLCVAVFFAIVGGLIVYEASGSNALNLSTFLLIVVVIYVPFGMSLSFNQYLYLGLQKVKSMNAVDLAQRISFILVLGVGFYFFGASDAETVFSLFVSMAILLAITVFVLLKTLAAKSQAPPLENLTQKALHYGFISYLANLFSHLVLKLDQVMVLSISGESASGFYALAVKLTEPLQAIPTSVGMILFAKMSQVNDPHAKKKGLFQLIAITFPVVLGLLALSYILIEPIVGVFFSHMYMPSSVSFIYLLPGTGCLAISVLCQNYLATRERPWAMVIGPLVAFVFNIPLNLIFIEKFGEKGAALSSSICYGLWLLVVLIIVLTNKEKVKNA